MNTSLSLLRKSFLSLIVVALLLPYTATATATASDIPATPSGTQYIAKASGKWNAATTWTNGATPVAGSVVIIPSAYTVTIDQLEPNATKAPKWVRVEGTLAFATTNSTRFYAETIYVTSTGHLTLGTAAAPLSLSYTAEIIFTSPGTNFDHVWDPEQMSRGLVAEGTVKIYGTTKTPYVVVTNDVFKGGTTTLLLQSTPSNWQANDEIVLAGTYFRRNQPFQDEKRTIQTFAGTSLTVSPAFSYDHRHVFDLTTKLPFHVANLTRNVIFKSNTTTQVYDRGHVILMSADSQIQGAAFTNLGRTNKKVSLDDFYVDTALGMTVKQNAANVNNHRGRYSLHVHKTGYGTSLTVPQTKILYCVVNGTPGWGFVNHGSHVDMSNDVAYNFDGAGFVTEDGNELGTFANDIAIHGNGNGEYRKARINFQNAARPQAIADFAFTGDGFWFNGPALHVSNDVANSCNGNGMIWHTTGAVNPSTADATHTYGTYTNFPMDKITTVYGTSASTLKPRTWMYDANATVIADLPILACSNIHSYATFAGFRLRFNNHDAVDWYNEDPFRYDLQINAAAGQGNIRSVPTRLTENVSSLTLWNDEAAVLMRYAGNAAFTTVKAISRLDFDETATNNPGVNPIEAMEAYQSIVKITWSGLTVEGWDVANWTATGTNTGDHTYLTTPVFRNYVLFGKWYSGQTSQCPAPTGLIASVQNLGSQATMTWNGSSSNNAFLVRYRQIGAQQWMYVRVAGGPNQVIASTTAGQAYEFQVVAGCTERVSVYVRAVFNT